MRFARFFRLLGGAAARLETRLITDLKFQFVLGGGLAREGAPGWNWPSTAVAGVHDTSAAWRARRGAPRRTPVARARGGAGRYTIYFWFDDSAPTLRYPHARAGFFCPADVRHARLSYHFSGFGSSSGLAQLLVFR